MAQRPTTGSQVAPSTGARRVFEHLAAVLEWTAADKSILGALIFLGFSIPYWLVGLYILYHPQFTPYLDPAFMPIALAIQTAMFGAWVIFLSLCLVVRRRHPDAHGLVPTLMILVAVQVVYGGYFFGLYTSPYFGVSALGSLVTGYVWFERRPMIVITVVMLGGGAALAVAEAFHLIPSAPLFSWVPLHDGVLATTYIVSVGGVTLVMAIAVVPWVAFIVSEFHERGRHLAEANDLISRYVAIQLSEQIERGNYDLLDRHRRCKLTLFFSDIQGFGSISDRVEPEELSSVLNEYLSEMTEIATLRGATIDKFVGDAIMIFFGAPVATTDRDHALQTVRMAIAMQGRLVALRAKWLAEGFPHPFHVRIGVNTGHASIGNFGSRERMDYTAIGRQVNLAARLQSHCEPDRILISHSTWVLVSDAIDCVPKGEIQVKGIREPVAVYEVGVDKGV